MNQIVTNMNDLKEQDLTIPIQNVKYWDSDYITEKLNAITNTTHKMFFFLLWRSGVRVSEALGIQKQHVDLQNFTITIRWLKKRKAMTRVIPMHPDVKNTLEYYASSMKFNDPLFGFTRQRADQLAKQYFDGNCHKFRHSFAVNWLRSGGDLYLLSKMLGHSSIKITEQYLDIVPVDIGKELLKIKF